MNLGAIKIPEWAEHDINALPADFTGDIEFKQTRIEIFQGGVSAVNISYRVRGPRPDTKIGGTK